MKTCLFSKSSLLLLLVHSVVFVFFGGSQRGGLASVDGPRQPPWAGQVPTDLSASTSTAPLLPTRLLRKGNPVALAILGSVICRRRTGRILHFRPALLDYSNNSSKCSSF